MIFRIIDVYDCHDMCIKYVKIYLVAMLWLHEVFVERELKLNDWKHDIHIIDLFMLKIDSEMIDQKLRDKFWLI